MAVMVAMAVTVMEIRDCRLAISGRDRVRHFFLPPTPLGIPRGWSGWSGGRAGSKGAAPSLSGLPEGVGDEKTAVRFTVDASKDIVNVNQLTKRLLTRALNADSKD